MNGLSRGGTDRYSRLLSDSRWRRLSCSGRKSPEGTRIMADVQSDRVRLSRTPLKPQCRRRLTPVSVSPAARPGSIQMSERRGRRSPP
jgi:hypothetical protein